jgi:excinuclease ABC subunit C
MTKERAAGLKIPDAPGVYFFMGPRKEILYIGKATSLRSRVRSYFTHDIREKRSALIERMVDEARTIDWTETDSVLEALILEANLIRTHKPRYNTDLKDDKSWNHLVITNEEWPRVLVVRGKDLATRFTDDELSYVFGPFTSGTLFRDALKIVKRIFRFYDTDTPVDAVRTKLARGMIDFNRQIGLYPKEGDLESYRTAIRHLRMFFEGKKRTIIRELEREMMRLARAERFEEANIVKKKIFALTHIEDVSLIKDEYRPYQDNRTMRIEAYDVAHTAGKEMVGVMTVVQGSERIPGEYRTFTIKTVPGANDPAALTEMLERRLAHTEWRYPALIVVDGNSVQKRAAERVLDAAGVVIPVVAVVKDEKHRPQRFIGPTKLVREHQAALLLAHAEAHRFSLSLHRKKRAKRLFA